MKTKTEKETKIEIWERWEEKDGKVFQILSYDLGRTWEKKHIPHLERIPFTTFPGR